MMISQRMKAVSISKLLHQTRRRNAVDCLTELQLLALSMPVQFLRVLALIHYVYDYPKKKLRLHFTATNGCFYRPQNYPTYIHILYTSSRVGYNLIK